LETNIENNNYYRVCSIIVFTFLSARRCVNYLLAFNEEFILV
jgi:hypothetical protein